MRTHCDVVMDEHLIRDRGDGRPKKVSYVCSVCGHSFDRLICKMTHFVNRREKDGYYGE